MKTLKLHDPGPTKEVDADTLSRFGYIGYATPDSHALRHVMMGLTYQEYIWLTQYGDVSRGTRYESRVDAIRDADTDTFVVFGSYDELFRWLGGLPEVKE